MSTDDTPSRDSVIAYLRSLKTGEALEVTKDALIGVGWSHRDEEGESVYPDDGGREADVESASLTALGGYLIGWASRERKGWVGRLADNARNPQTPRLRVLDPVPGRKEAERLVEDAAIAAGYVLPWRSVPAAQTDGGGS